MSAKDETRKNHLAMNDLWSYFVRVVEILKPEVFVSENVPEFIRSQEFETYKKKVEIIGYHLDYGVLNAYEYGVPQKRKRAFCFGSRIGKPHLPLPTEKRSTVRDAIGHLPLEPNGVDWHIGRTPTEKSKERYKVIPPGGNRFDLMQNRPDLTPACWMKKKTGTTDVFCRMLWRQPASTIRTEFFKPEKGRYLHPEAHRPITHREAACIQTFPDSFKFVGSKVEVARQIGEAVPPTLAEEVAKAVFQHLKSKK
jgi:DNA (cytosine-5)-methyltransferase 1